MISEQLASSRTLYPDDSREETRADETTYINISIPVPKLSVPKLSLDPIQAMLAFYAL